MISLKRKNGQQGIGAILVLFIAATIVLLIFLSFWLGQKSKEYRLMRVDKKQASDAASTLTPAPSPLVSSSPTSAPNRALFPNTFTNTTYNYRIGYPDEWAPSTCRYQEQGVTTVDPVTSERVEFQPVGWNCPATDSPFGRLEINVSPSTTITSLKTQEGYTIKKQPSKELGGKTFTIYTMTNDGDQIGFDQAIYYYYYDISGKNLYIFVTHRPDDAPIVEKMLTTLTL